MLKWTETSYNEEEMEKNLLQPYEYLAPLRVYGLFVTKLPDAYNYWLRVPADKLAAIRNIIVKINNSIAMQDDIQDDSLYRRTQPAAHRVFGTGMAVNTFVHLQFLALEDVVKLGHPKAVEIYCKGYLRFIRGAGANIYWRETQCDVTQKDYNQMAINLTGSMMVMFLQLMQLFSDNKTDYEYLARIFALYHQMRDDYVDLKKPQAVEEGSRISELNKLSTLTFCDDFTEGKISTPVINSLKSEQREIILDAVAGYQVKEYLLSLLEEAGGVEKTRELLRELEADILAEIQRLGGNPMFEDLVRDLRAWDD